MWHAADIGYYQLQLWFMATWSIPAEYFPFGISEPNVCGNQGCHYQKYIYNHELSWCQLCCHWWNWELLIATSDGTCDDEAGIVTTHRFQWYYLTSGAFFATLKWKCHHFYRIFITGWTWSCQREVTKILSKWHFHYSVIKISFISTDVKIQIFPSSEHTSNIFKLISRITISCIAIFHKYCWYIKYCGIITNLTQMPRCRMWNMD